MVYLSCFVLDYESYHPSVSASEVLRLQVFIIKKLHYFLIWKIKKFDLKYSQILPLKKLLCVFMSACVSTCAMYV